jgi:hypothetical protein
VPLNFCCNCFFNRGTGRLNQKSEGEINDDFRLGYLVPPWVYIVPEYSTENHELPYPHINRQLSQVVPQGSQRAICNGKIVLGSGMFIPDPDFFHPGSRIQQQQKRGEKKLVVLPFFGSIHKILK